MPVFLREFDPPIEIDARNLQGSQATGQMMAVVQRMRSVPLREASEGRHFITPENSRSTWEVEVEPDPETGNHRAVVTAWPPDMTTPIRRYRQEPGELQLRNIGSSLGPQREVLRANPQGPTGYIMTEFVAEGRALIHGDVYQSTEEHIGGFNTPLIRIRKNE